MENISTNFVTLVYEKLVGFLRKIMYTVLSADQIPNHIAFIMDGNRRYARKCNAVEGVGHLSGYSALMKMLKYCYELGVKYVTIYAFSIDNFKRSPQEVQSLMDLMLDKIEEIIREESMVNRYGIRVYFVGNLKLLNEPVRLAAERAMSFTAKNSRAVLSICIAYTSTDEILHAAEYSCKEKLNSVNIPSTKKAADGIGSSGENERISIKCVDIGKHMYTAIAPDPDIIIRSSGETRLSNFLLWQSAHTCLYSPSSLWPEIGFWHLVWAILNFQRNYLYLDKKRKQG